MSRCANEFATIDQLMVHATLGLFRTMGVALAEVPDEQIRAPRAAIAATMGFSGDHLRGGLTLLIDQPTAVALYPAVDLSAIDASRDACGEMVNMLVGQLKSQLAMLGVTLHLALPVTIGGDGVQLFHAWSGMSSWQVFRSHHGLVRVRLDLRFARDFAFAPDRAPAPGAAPGEALFF